MPHDLTIDGRPLSFTCHSGRLLGTELPNHLDGIRACLDANVFRVEIDIHSIDGDDFLVSHASRLEESTMSTGAVGRLTPKLALTLERNDAPGERPPLLSEVLELMRGSSTHLQLDLKDWRPLPPGRVRTLLELAEPLGERVLVSSGQDWNLRALAAAKPALRLGFDPDRYVAARSRDVPMPARLGAYGYRDDHPLALGRSQTAGDYWRERVADLVAKCPAVEEFFVEYRLLLQALHDGVSTAALLHEHGVTASAWTVDYLDEDSLDLVRTLAGSGVDRITTNTSQRFYEKLRT
jgi:glycerophosphoryl diester phosphodiesterase